MSLLGVGYDIASWHRPIPYPPPFFLYTRIDGGGGGGGHGPLSYASVQVNQWLVTQTYNKL